MRREPETRFTYDAKNKRYRDVRTGRYITPASVRRQVDHYIAWQSKEVAALATALRGGAISLARWRIGMREIIAESHLATIAAARGGWARMRFSDYGRAGQIIRREYKWLSQFVTNLNAKRVILDDRFERRAQLYAAAARGSYESAMRVEMMGRGRGEERSILNTAEHCAGCLAEAARGWVRIGALVPIGARDCIANCKCTIEYR